MKLSIIVPVFNSGLTIEKCIKSILKQTFTDFEIICVDDGGQDKSPDIIKQLASLDSRIRIIFQEHQGVASARNTGLRAAVGEYIGFVDSDDTIVPEMYERLISTIETDMVDLVVCGANLVEVTGKKFSDFDFRYLNPEIPRRSKVHQKDYFKVNAFLWNKLFRKKLIDENSLRFPDGMWYEDSAFVWCYLIYCKTMSGINEKLYNYHRYSTSIMGKTFAKNTKSLDHLGVSEFVSRFLQDKPKGEDYLWDFLEFTLSNFRESLKHVRSYYRIICIVRLVKILNSYKLSDKSKIESVFILNYRFLKLLLNKIMKKFTTTRIT